MKWLKLHLWVFFHLIFICALKQYCHENDFYAVDLYGNQILHGSTVIFTDSKFQQMSDL